MDPTVFERIYESFCTSFFCQNSACAPRTQKLVIPASADRASAKCNMNQRIGTKDKTKNVGEMARAARFSREMAAARGLHGDPAQARRDSPNLGRRHDGRLHLAAAFRRATRAARMLEVHSTALHYIGLELQYVHYMVTQFRPDTLSRAHTAARRCRATTATRCHRAGANAQVLDDLGLNRAAALLDLVAAALGRSLIWTVVSAWGHRRPALRAVA